jgi:hypothetical protein
MSKRVSWHRIAPLLTKEGSVYMPPAGMLLTLNGRWVKSLAAPSDQDNRLFVVYMTGWSENKKVRSRYNWTVYELKEVDF